MPHLNLIRAAAHDVAAARAVLRERSLALEALVRTAVEHGASPAEVARASEAALPTAALHTDPHPPMLVA